MNWRRGLLRLLIVAEGAVLLAVGALWALLQVPNPPPVVPPSVTFALVGGLLVVPALMLAAVGYAVTWAARGFR